ncbi:hypothetical protein ACFLU6_06685 [Acidobacteriota bacterium]
MGSAVQTRLGNRSDMARRLLFILISILLLLFIIETAPAEESAAKKGTLVFHVKDFVVKSNIKKKVRKDLERRGIRWGMVDNTLVITFIHMRHIDADLPYLTRWGEEQKVELVPGEYSISCISLDLKKYERSADEFIAKNAYVNEGMLPFLIEPGKTTTIDILPIYRKQVKKNVLTRQKLYKADLEATVIKNGEAGKPVFLNKRKGNSIRWGKYKGPLKFHD